MPTVTEMKEALKQVNSSKSWWQRVDNEMTDRQITAIYLRYRSEGKL